MRRTGIYALNCGDVVTAWTEYEIFPDAADVTEPEYVDVEVQFRITVRGYDATFDDPADGPEGEIECVRMVPGRYSTATRTERTTLVPAPPDIDDWARMPAREATLFQQALDNAFDGR